MSITVVLHFFIFLDYLLILTRFVYIPIIKNVRVFLVILMFTFIQKHDHVYVNIIYDV